MPISNSLFSFLFSSPFSQGPFSLKLHPCIVILPTFPLSHILFTFSLSHAHTIAQWQSCSLTTAPHLQELSWFCSQVIVMLCSRSVWVKLVPTRTEQNHVKVLEVPEGFSCCLCTIHDGPKWQKLKRTEDITGGAMSCLSLALLLSPVALSAPKC